MSHLPIFQSQTEAHGAQRLSQSNIWNLQRTYFEKQGPEAWRSGQVPHYVSSNPHLAGQYADMVFAFCRDLARKGRTDQKAHILELGGGSGRLCYHFLKAFEKRAQGASFRMPAWQYLLTDLAQSNVEFWQKHPRFRPFVQGGQLDFACLDALEPQDAQLLGRGEAIGEALAEGPVIVLANYFFDSIPQDLFYIKGYELAECRIVNPARDEMDDPTEALKHTYLDLQYHEMPGPAYENRQLNLILDSYRGKFEESHLWFPQAGIQCLQRLLHLCRDELVLLSADKGCHRLEDLEGAPQPGLVHHGSFSLGVNYHAIRLFCALEGGLPLSSKQVHQHLDLHCMIFGDRPEELKELNVEASRTLDGFSPDNFFSLKKVVERHIEELSYTEILAIIRLGGYDARLFGQCIPRLARLQLGSLEVLSLLKVCGEVWDNYFPLGEDADLAFMIGNLLWGFGFSEEAMDFFRLSEQIYGPTEGSLYNLAVCLMDSGRKDEALASVERLLGFFPEHELALELREQIFCLKI